MINQNPNQDFNTIGQNIQPPDNVIGDVSDPGRKAENTEVDEAAEQLEIENTLDDLRTRVAEGSGDETTLAEIARLEKLTNQRVQDEARIEEMLQKRQAEGEQA